MGVQDPRVCHIAADQQTPLPVALVEALNKIAGGPHPGFRANHAEGVMASGRFTPSSQARALSKAPHFAGAAMPLTVRYSNDSGHIHFSDGALNARPHGMAIRFHLPDGGSTDIVTNSTKAFPVSTPEDFLALLNAVVAIGPGVAKPTPLDDFIASHPSTARYFASWHAAPVSFGTLTHHGLNAFKFTNGKGESRYIRYRIVPAGGDQFLTDAVTEAAAPCCSIRCRCLMASSHRRIRRWRCVSRPTP